MRLSLLSPILALALAACGLADDADLAAGGHSLAALPPAGTPAAVGALLAANDCAVDFEVLDGEARLYASAARALVTARDGADGICGTADDQRFRSLGDLLDVHGMGPRNVERLVDWSGAAGFAPDYAGGVVDGVSFTDHQAHYTLLEANRASFETLDTDARLRADAARNIVAARPIASLEELRAVYRVGPVTMATLRDWATPDEPAPADPDEVACQSSADCDPGRSCIGRPHDGSSDHGRCRDLAPIPGENAECTPEAPVCGDGLVCTALSHGWGFGFCRPAWMEGWFDGEGLALPAGGAAVTAEVVVVGLATVPEDVWVVLSLDHPDPHALTITLESPNGDVGTVWNGPAMAGEAFEPFRVVRGIPGDDAVNGRYRLRVTGAPGAPAGDLTAWSLGLTSRWD